MLSTELGPIRFLQTIWGNVRLQLGSKREGVELSELHSLEEQNRVLDQISLERPDYT